MKNPWSVATSTKHARQTKKQKESSPEQPSEFVPLSKYVADLLNKRITDFYEGIPVKFKYMEIILI